MRRKAIKEGSGLLVFSFWFLVSGSGFRSGFRVPGSEFRVRGPGSEFRVRVQGSGFKVPGSEFRVQGLAFRFSVSV